jgi:hypothetical protein
MTDEIHVTVIATGFDRSGMPRRIATHPINRTIDGKLINHQLESVSVAAQSNQAGEFKPKIFNTNDLDIPTFLRQPKQGG